MNMDISKLDMNKVIMELKRNNVKNYEIKHVNDIPIKQTTNTIKQQSKQESEDSDDTNEKLEKRLDDIESLLKKIAEKGINTTQVIKTVVEKTSNKSDSINDIDDEFDDDVGFIPKIDTDKISGSIDVSSEERDTDNSDSIELLKKLTK